MFAGEHYLGKPADFTDKIITRRVGLVQRIPGFCDKQLDLGTAEWVQRFP